MSYGKFYLRGDSIDYVFMGERRKVTEVAQQLADENNEFIEVWPDPSNDDYKPLAVCSALPQKGEI